MVAAPKFPVECDAEYTLNKETRRKFTDCAFILTMPVSDFGVISRHIDCIPEDKLMTKKPEDVYLDIKTALYNIMTNENESAALPSKMDVFIRKVHSYFSLRKTKANFIKEYIHAKDENEPRWAQRKIAKERQQTYIHAQHLGNALTMKGLVEFKDQYIDDKTTLILEEGSLTQVSAPAQEDTTTPITPTSETETDTTSIKKNCTLERNKKKVTILHPTAYLTSPNKPKIQHVDREAIKDLCDIAMEFLVHDKNYKNGDAIKEYKSYVEDQDRLASFDFFPGVRDFLSAMLKIDREDLVQALWNNEIRLKATGSARILMDIISYTLTDFSSNCKQPLHSTNNHERTPFVKYIVPMFKYFGQETNLIEFSWCEKSLETYGMAALESSDFVKNTCDRKYADALGKGTTTENEEFFIESSSGFEKENINHSLDDTLKLLAECSNALLHVIKHSKKASIDTITKKCTLGVQVIKQTLTLTKVSLSKSGKWKLVEVRSACIPTSWELRSQWNLLFEMLATIYHESLQQRELDTQITNEVCRLVEIPSVSVVDHFLNMNA